MELAPWGRLNRTLIGAVMIDIHEELFSIGKGEQHNWNITSQHVDQRILDRLSTNQCVISKDCSSYENPVFIEDLSRNGTFVNSKKIGYKRKYILKTGDVIAFNREDFKFFEFIDCHQEQHGVNDNIFQKYHMGKILGTGAQGSVRIITDRKTFQKRALKIIKRTDCRSDYKKMREVEIMKELEHPLYITKCYSSESDKNHIYIFLEYMEGGDLLHRILCSKYLPVNTAKHFFLQLCHAVKYLHDKGCIHRDIKPDNILLESKHELANLKLSDFGLSRMVSSELYTLCGTFSYMAPEIHSGSRHYTNKIDVWSLGIVLYAMLYGKIPFATVGNETTADRIKFGKFDFPVFPNVPDSAKDLIRKMLTVDVSQRLSINGVLDQSWLQNHGSSYSDTKRRRME